MFSQIAQVFSSSGIVLPGRERVPIPGQRKDAAGEANASRSGFASQFDQASAKLEISKQGQDKAADAGPRKADGQPLSDSEKKQVGELAKRDKEVKAHEAAHQASAGGYTRGGANYEYESGPDGKQYAVGGHVEIDASPVQGNPRETLAKAQVVQRAALAPADPSGADRAVAASAARMAIQAQKELAHDAGGKENGTGARPLSPYSRRPTQIGAAISVYA